VGYKAFISYRRGDASTAARWIRRRLLAFRPPPALLERLKPPQRAALVDGASYYLDTSYEFANEDFWTASIEPALRTSEWLIVVSSPSALLRLADGSENLVAREIDTFLRFHGEDEGRQRIVLALAPGAATDRFPGRLQALGRQWDWVDLRGLSRWGWIRPGASERLGDAFLKIAAALFQVPQDLLPVLRQEEARRLGRLRLAALGGAAAVMLTLSGALGWAVVERRQALRAEAQAIRNYEAARDSVDRLLGVVGGGLRDMQGIGVQTVDQALAQVDRLVTDLAHVNPGDPLLERSRAKMLHEFARTYQRAGDAVKARQIAEQGVKIRRHLAGILPGMPEIRADLASSLDLVGDLARAGRQYGDARAQFAEALTLRRALLDGAPGHGDRSEWLVGLSQSHVRLGDTDSDESGLDTVRGSTRGSTLVESAGGHYRASLALSADLYRREPQSERWQRELSWSFNKMGDFNLGAGRLDDAHAAYGHALCLRRGLLDRAGHNTRYASDVSWTLQKIGNARLASRDMAGAEAAFLESLVLRQRLVVRDVRDDRVLYRDYFLALERLAMLKQRTGQPDIVLALVHEAQRVRERLRDTDGSIPTELFVPDTTELERWARTMLGPEAAVSAERNADGILNAKVYAHASRLLTARGDTARCLADLEPVVASLASVEMAR
jgi:tetratricopeptide (TPR) repeat protein